MHTVDWLLAAVSAVAGLVAAVSGFGIGSLLTPLLAASLGLKLAVAIVSVPHVIGTSIRFWTMRRHVDARVLWSFGLTSAAGGLIGALLHAGSSNRILTIVFALLLVFAGFFGVTGWSDRWRFSRRMGSLAGALSGLFGGLVGNQGGIRSAAMLGFDLAPEAFVATATAVALLVDLPRVPVYVMVESSGMRAAWLQIVISTLGVIVGTFVGMAALPRIPQRGFRRVVSALILVLGVYMLAREAGSG